MDRNKIIKLLVTLAAIVVFVASISKLVNGNSMSLSEYAALQNPDGTISPSPSPEADTSLILDEADSLLAPECSLPTSTPDSTTPDSTTPSPESTTTLVGASLNAKLVAGERTVYAEGFYYEPLSENLRRYITGVSYPNSSDESFISFDELRYIHILHYDFDGVSVEGELICNQTIAQDLVEIFYALYQNEYQLGSVLLIDEFDGDLNASAEANNSYCFYASAESDTGLSSKHGHGLAVDINPAYNPLISYTEDGQETISPATSANYTNRSASFPYKIDENDLCYKLFTQYGFVWGGNRNNEKAYGHFHKN